MKTFMVVVLLALAACKGKDSKPAETKPAETKAVDPVKTSNVLVFAPVKMLASQGAQQNELSIDGAGKVFLDGKEVGSLTAAGELTVGGKLVATLAADGKMTVVGEPGEQLTITPAGAILDKDGKVGLEPRPDGTMGGAIADAMKGTTMKVEGDKSAYRALMFAWLGVSKSPP